MLLKCAAVYPQFKLIAVAIVCRSTAYLCGRSRKSKLMHLTVLAECRQRGYVLQLYIYLDSFNLITMGTHLVAAYISEFSPFPSCVIAC